MKARLSCILKLDQATAPSRPPPPNLTLVLVFCRQPKDGVPSAVWRDLKQQVHKPPPQSCPQCPFPPEIQVGRHSDLSRKCWLHFGPRLATIRTLVKSLEVPWWTGETGTCLYLTGQTHCVNFSTSLSCGGLGWVAVFPWLLRPNYHKVCVQYLYNRQGLRLLTNCFSLTCKLCDHCDCVTFFFPNL